LHGLVEEIQRLKINSIAIPRIGCGCGGLDWERVKPMVIAALSNISDIEGLIFE
jgi:O-acetyl-ADP-ribose deacetylase (regulator of RNase III)